MYCDNCGKKLESNDLYCGNCGKKVEPHDLFSKKRRAKMVTGYNNEAVKKQWLIVIPILVLIGIICTTKIAKTLETANVFNYESMTNDIEWNDPLFEHDYVKGEENVTNAYGGCISTYRDSYKDARMTGQGNWLYYYTPMRDICKMVADGDEGEQITLLTEESFKEIINEKYDEIMISDPKCYDLCVIGDWLYWSSADGSIWRLRTDGKELTLLVKDRLPKNGDFMRCYEKYYGGRHFIVYDGWIYYTVLEGIQKDTKNFELKSYLARTTEDGSDTQIISDKYSVCDVYDPKGDKVVVPGGLQESAMRDSQIAWPIELMCLCPDDETIYVNACYYNNQMQCKRIVTYDIETGDKNFITNLPQYISSNTEWWNYNKTDGWTRGTNEGKIVPGMIVFQNDSPGCPNYYCWKTENLGYRFSSYNISDPLFEAVYDNKVFCVSSLGITIGNDVLNGDSEASEICYAPCGKVYYAIDHWPLSFGLYRTNIDGTEWEDVTWMVY